MVKALVRKRLQTLMTVKYSLLRASVTACKIRRSSADSNATTEKMLASPPISRISWTSWRNCFSTSSENGSKYTEFCSANAPRFCSRRQTHTRFCEGSLGTLYVSCNQRIASRSCMNSDPRNEETLVTFVTECSYPTPTALQSQANSSEVTCHRC